MIHPTRRLLAALAILLTVSGCTLLKRKAYEGFWGRDTWQQPERVVADLGLSPGQRVADIGAGGGYFTFRLAQAVGPEGRVYAVDVDDDMLAYLDDRIAEDGRSNVETVRAELDDPRIPEPGVDLVFLANTYHHIGSRVAYFDRVRGSLLPGGRVAIVELLEPTGIRSWLIGSHYTDPEVIRTEMKEAGYTLQASHDYLERQSFQIFQPIR